MSDDDETTLMISDCMQRESKLGEWEREFIDSISTQQGRGKTLTPKQIAVLAEIWERVTA
jgi:hypothetical protein